VLREAPADVSVVVLDLVMPGLSAGTVLHQIRTIAPHVRVVLSSGYAAQARDEGMDVDAHLPKPYTGADLAGTLAQLLDGPVATASSA
jgi:CheY-like chemotaxis protein